MSPGSVGLLPAGVELAHLLLDLLEGVGDEDRVVERLAHLVHAVGADEPADRADVRARESGKTPPSFSWSLVFGLVGHAAVHLVEATRDLARQLDVRHLILADRHQLGRKARMSAV